MDSLQFNPETPVKTQPNDHQLPPLPLSETNTNYDSPPRDSTNEPMKKVLTPDRLRVPVAFKHPERYRSPTDAMMSPVTKGLLARSRKTSGSLNPPSFNLPSVPNRKTESGLSSLGC